MHKQRLMQQFRATELRLLQQREDRDDIPGEHILCEGGLPQEPHVRLRIQIGPNHHTGEVHESSLEGNGNRRIRRAVARMVRDEVPAEDVVIGREGERRDGVEPRRVVHVVPIAEHDPLTVRQGEGDMRGMFVAR